MTDEDDRLIGVDGPEQPSPLVDRFCQALWRAIQEIGQSEEARGVDKIDARIVVEALLNVTDVFIRSASNDVETIVLHRDACAGFFADAIAADAAPAPSIQ